MGAEHASTCPQMQDEQNDRHWLPKDPFPIFKVASCTPIHRENVDGDLHLPDANLPLSTHNPPPRFSYALCVTRSHFKLPGRTTLPALNDPPQRLQHRYTNDQGFKDRPRWKTEAAYPAPLGERLDGDDGRGRRSYRTLSITDFMASSCRWMGAVI